MSTFSFTVSALFLSVFVVSVNEGKNERIVFPDSVVSVSQVPRKEIPLSLIRQLNEVSDEKEFFQNLIHPFIYDMADLESEFSERIGQTNTGEFPLRAAKMAKCAPELQVVSLKPNTSAATFYYPSCTRVERCGGCCSHHLLACQPIEKKIIPMSVVVADYLGGNKLQFRGEKIVEVEQHTKCKCECKIRPESCTRYQTYNPDKCQCECRNSNEAKTCGLRSKKLWNSNTCSCMCREELECGSGYYFDPFTCNCIPYRTRKSLFIIKKH